MANTDLTTRYERIRAVQWARSEGYSQSGAADALNLNIGTVKKYWNKPLPPVNPADVISQACALKQDPRHAHRGPAQLAAEIDGIGMGGAVSETTLSRVFAERGLAQKKFNWRGGGRPYWTDQKPDAPRHTYQFDTVKLRTRDGLLHEIWSLADAYSSAHDLSFADGNLGGCLRRSLDRLGVPRGLNGDNGFGMICQASGRHSVFQNVAAVAGVERIHYIPEGDPNKNAAVESFHGWLQREHEAYGRMADRAELAAFLSDRLEFWNHRKWCSSLGGKAARRTPADVHEGIARGVEVDQPAPVVSDQMAYTTVSYTRLVDRRGFFVLRNPGLVVYLGADLAGHFCRCDIAPDGSARFFVRFAADHGERVFSEIVNGRVVIDYDGRNTRLVAVADLEWSMRGHMRRAWLYQATRLELDRDVVPMAYDWAGAERDYAKRIRKGRPTAYPGYCELNELPDGSWFVTDTRTGEQILSHLCVPDHAREI